MTAMYTELSVSAQTAYASLVQAARAADLARSVADVPGGFASKTASSGRVYWYYQVRVDGRLQQVYVGPDDAATRALMADHEDPTKRAGQDHVQRLAAAALSLGCYGVVPKHARVLARLADHGLFRAGGILVGTHAYLAYQNHLGVLWSVGEQTVDLDFAHAAGNISLALPSDLRVDMPSAIESLKMGFIPVSAGTRYVKPDEPDFDLDFLTAIGRRGLEPVPVPQLGLTLQPLKFLEYPMEAAIPVVLIAGRAAIVANLPRPERYALAKLIVHAERRGSNPTKARKDLAQAASLIAWLTDHQPDALEDAWTDLLSRGPGWRSRARESLLAMDRSYPGLIDARKLG